MSQEIPQLASHMAPIWRTEVWYTTRLPCPHSPWTYQDDAGWLCRTIHAGLWLFCEMFCGVTCWKHDSAPKSSLKCLPTNLVIFSNKDLRIPMLTSAVQSLCNKDNIVPTLSGLYIRGFQKNRTNFREVSLKLLANTAVQQVCYAKDNTYACHQSVLDRCQMVLYVNDSRYGNFISEQFNHIFVVIC